MPQVVLRAAAEYPTERKLASFPPPTDPSSDYAQLNSINSNQPRCHPPNKKKGTYRTAPSLYSPLETFEIIIFSAPDSP